MKYIHMKSLKELLIFLPYKLGIVHLQWKNKQKMRKIFIRQVKNWIVNWMKISSQQWNFSSLQLTLYLSLFSSSLFFTTNKNGWMSDVTNFSLRVYLWCKTSWIFSLGWKISLSPYLITPFISNSIFPECDNDNSNENYLKNDTTIHV
jgi:hypothetical protein